MSAARCGTPSGYNRHKNADEKPCDACARAKQEYDKRNRSAPEKTLRNRLSARAQSRAHMRLVALYPDVYAAFYAEEREELYREAGLEVFAVGAGRSERQRTPTDVRPARGVRAD